MFEQIKKTFDETEQLRFYNINEKGFDKIQ